MRSEYRVNSNFNYASDAPVAARDHRRQWNRLSKKTASRGRSNEKKSKKAPSGVHQRRNKHWNW